MLRFGEEPPQEVERQRWVPELDPRVESPIPGSVREVLTDYLEGRDVDPGSQIPVRIGGTAFQRRVWAALREVPRGRVRTYAGLGADAGAPRAHRAIGMAMNQNPIAIAVPCHRVVGQGFTLGGFGGGLPRKRHLLALEGVQVDGDRVLPGQLDLLR